MEDKCINQDFKNIFKKEIEIDLEGGNNGGHL